MYVSFMMNSSSEDLCFNVVFSMSVGMFRLGATVNDTLDMLSDKYPRLQLDLHFSDQEHVCESDVQVNIVEWGIRLRFQPLSQKLYMIDVHNLDTFVSYIINGFLIRNHDHPTTLNLLRKALGPLYPGKFVSDGNYLLSLKGAGLLFGIPEEFQTNYIDGDTLPYILPNKSSPVLRRIYIVPRNFDFDHPEEYPDNLSCTANIVLVKKNSFISSHFHIRTTASDTDQVDNREAIEGSRKELSLTLGMTPQDVVSHLGNPDFASLTSVEADPFVHKYEYRSIGIEVYFAKYTHYVYRIVAHTNLAQNQAFGRFCRCGFSISPACSNCSPCETVGCHSNVFSQCRSDSRVCVPENNDSDQHDVIDSLMPWAKAQLLLSKWYPRVDQSAGLVRDDTDQNSSRLASEDDLDIAAAIKSVPAGCPFPPSRLYAYPGLNIVFEVTAGGFMSNVTILDPSLNVNS